jgi:tetratricopeptide (TPR) repeat protein
VSETAPRISRLERLYHEYLVDQDSAALVHKVEQYYTTGALERLLQTAPRLARRAAAMMLGHLGDYRSNHALGMSLHDEDRSVRLLAENAIRACWCRDGDDEQRLALSEIVRLNAAREFEEAVDRADRLITENVDFAEAWNQRAIAYYSLAKYHRSIDDCRQAVELNPYHFGAVAGMGQCYLRIGNELWALDCFRRALALNPNLEGIRANVVRLETRLRRD